MVGLIVGVLGFFVVLDLLFLIEWRNSGFPFMACVS